MIEQALLAGLGLGLFKAFEKLMEKGAVDPALERGLEPLRDWLTRGYDAEKDAQALREAVGKALDDLEKDPVVDRYDNLVAALKLTGLTADQQALLTAAAIEMVDYEPRRLPGSLLKALEMDEARRDLLARFLLYFRRRLAEVDKYRDGVAYADRLAQRGLLAGLAQEVGDLQAQARRLVTIQAAMAAERRLGTDDAAALARYLATVREQWNRLSLPLIRKRTGDVTSANLIQVFVPLSLRDRRAEEQARREMERRSRSPRAGTNAMEDKEVRPVELGELFARYPRFILTGPPGCGKTTLLARLALAFAEGRAGEDLGWRGARLLPVLVRLRNFGGFLEQRGAEFFEPSSGALVAYLDHYFRCLQRLELTADFFDRRLTEGACLVLLDGLDEVSEHRDQVAQQVCAFIDRYGNGGNRFGLASRPRGYESVEWQLRPCGLAEAQVNPLDGAGIGQLIGNLLAIIEPEARLRQSDRDDLHRAILNSSDLTQLAGIPLNCAALVQVYKYHGARLPERRVDVLDEIVDLLLGYWRVQQRGMARAEDLVVDAETGAGKRFRGVEEAVEVKKRRLSVLALALQERSLTEIDAADAGDTLAKYLLERERAPDLETARTWAENFLRNSHERSGLLVESDPGKYAFAHKNFLEFLAAGALVQQSKTLVDTVMERLDQEGWEQTILLAGAHPKLAEDLRSELVNRILDEAGARQQAYRVDISVEVNNRELHFKAGGLALKRILAAGRMARDMAGYLPGPEHERVEADLYTCMVDPELKPADRAAAADALDALGWLAEDLHTFARIEPPDGAPFYLGRYPVANVQYERFVKADDFGDRELWVNFPWFGADSQPAPGKDWGDAGWQWLQEVLKDPQRAPDGKRVWPRYWNDAHLGIARRGAPVVGVTWYEAGAYCRWLLRHWSEMDESTANPGWQPEALRLPTEAEWLQAAGGAQPKERFAWDAPGQATIGLDEILKRANVSESEINRTTPAGMFPLGVGRRYGVHDLAGNVWEWQANLANEKERRPGLRGGSWDLSWLNARPSIRGNSPPDAGWHDGGFRVLALPSKQL